MRAYADSSFILRLLLSEADSPQVIAAYRRQHAPPLFYLGIHSLEVQSGIRQRAFFRQKTGGVQAAQIKRERDSALARLNSFLIRRIFREIPIDFERVLQNATELAITYAEAMGARSIDLLHVACAIDLEAELFLTTDRRQSQVAKAEGLKVLYVNEP